MDLAKARQALDIGAKIDVCNKLLTQIAKAAAAQVLDDAGKVVSTGSVLVTATITTPDGGNGQSLYFPDYMAITVEETNVIGQALANIVMSRLTALQAELAAL